MVYDGNFRACQIVLFVKVHFSSIQRKHTRPRSMCSGEFAIAISLWLESQSIIACLETIGGRGNAFILSQSQTAKLD